MDKWPLNQLVKKQDDHDVEELSYKQLKIF